MTIRPRAAVRGVREGSGGRDAVQMEEDQGGEEEEGDQDKEAREAWEAWADRAVEGV